MSIRVPNLPLCMLSVALVATPLTSQTYTAAWYKGTAGGGVSLEGSNSSPVWAQVRGADVYPWDGAFAASRQAAARSDPAELSVWGSGSASDANSYLARGEAAWRFTDVVFSDGTGSPTVVPVRLSFEISADSMTGTFAHAGYVLEVSATQNGVRNSVSIANPSLGSTPRTFTTSPLSLSTETVCEFEIRAYVDGFGSRGQTGWMAASTHWSAQPFVLPAGVTANSSQAGISGNARSVAGPSYTPSLHVTSPAVAGSNATFSLSGGAPNGVGAYLFGFAPDGSSTPVVSWFVVNLPTVLLIDIPFTTDANGDASLQVPLDPALQGVHLGVQAVQISVGPSMDAHSTNPWSMRIG